MFLTNRKRKEYRPKPRNDFIMDFSMAPQRRQSRFDLRVIVIRHGERIDNAFGEDWFFKVFGNNPATYAHGFRHPILPHGLPKRASPVDYINDPPITRKGQEKSYRLGRQLNSSIGRIDSCYCSPASRCLLTADALLRGMKRKDIPLKIEPLLFEPLAWNAELQAAGEIPPFMSRGDWIKTGYNIDMDYRGLQQELDLYDDANSFYERSKYFFQSLEYSYNRAVSDGRARSRTILVIAHGPSTAVFPTIAKNEPFDIESFNNICIHSQYLDTVVLERTPTTGQWRQTAGPHRNV